MMSQIQLTPFRRVTTAIRTILQSAFRAANTDYILVNLATHKLTLYQNGKPHMTCPIAIGKNQTPTPIGNWHIINKKILTDPGPFGTRWLGLNRPGYGIHGTNQPWAIGTNVSQGCIRLHNADVELLFSLVSIGTPVIIQA